MTFTIPNDDTIFQIVCREQKKFGILAEINFRERDFPAEKWRNEIMAATKGLIDINLEDHFEVAARLVRGNGYGPVIILFDCEEEMTNAFENLIYGDDNAEDHGYSGRVHSIHCLTCDPTGQLMNENS